MARILVIDDDEMVADSLAAQLRCFGHEPTTSRDGRKGLEACEQTRFDLVLVDIFMPEMEGLEFVRIFRGRHPALPVIVMTGGMANDVRRDHTIGLYLGMVDRLGADATLKKPFDPGQLLQCVNTCLAGNHTARSAGI